MRFQIVTFVFLSIGIIEVFSCSRRKSHRRHRYYDDDDDASKWVSSDPLSEIDARRVDKVPEWTPTLESNGKGALTQETLTKLRAKYARKSNSLDFEFDDWNGWRQDDGLLCRHHRDCQWMDLKFGCTDQQNLNITNVSFARVLLTS